MRLCSLQTALPEDLEGFAGVVKALLEFYITPYDLHHVCRMHARANFTRTILKLSAITAHVCILDCNYKRGFVIVKLTSTPANNWDFYLALYGAWYRCVYSLFTLIKLHDIDPEKAWVVFRASVVKHTRKNPFYVILCLVVNIQFYECFVRPRAVRYCLNGRAEGGNGDGRHVMWCKIHTVSNNQQLHSVAVIQVLRHGSTHSSIFNLRKYSMLQ